MTKVTKRAISIFMAVLLMLSVMPVTAFAADNVLQIYCEGVRVDDNSSDPLRIMETEQKQLTVTYDGSETLPDGTSLVWSSPTPYLVYVDQNGVITGRDSSKGAIMRVWVAENIESLWLIGPSIADSIYSWMDENEIDNMDTEGIVDAMNVLLTPVFGEDLADSLCDSLRSVLDSVNVEISVSLVDADGNEIASSSTHVVCDKSEALTADFIPNGTYITNHESIPAQVEVGYEMDLTGITTPLRLNMGVNWKVTETKLGIDVSTDKATIDEDGHIVFNSAGTVKITATPDTEGLYDKLTSLIETMGGLANAGETIGWVMEEVFGMTVASSVIDALVVVINGIVSASSSDEAETLKKIVSTVSDWILGVTINDSVTVTIVDQIDVTSFEIYGDLSNLSAFGGNRTLTITNIQPEGAYITEDEVEWLSSDTSVAVVDGGLVTVRDGGYWGNSFTITATIDGVSATKSGSILGGNLYWPTDVEFSGPTELTVGDTATYSFTIYPSTLYDIGGLMDYNNIDVGLMIDGEIVYDDDITDGVLYISDGGEVDGGKSNSGTFTVTAVGGGVSTIYVRNHSSSQRIGTGVSDEYFVKELQVSVYQPVSEVSIDQGDSITVELSDRDWLLRYTGSVQLTATVGPEDATDQSLTWSSDNSSVTVDSNGLVSYTGYLRSAVTANITVTSQDNPEATDTIAVTFCQAVVHVTDVTLNAEEVTLSGEGSTYKLTATVSPSDAEDQSVTWTSGDTDVVTVSEDGTLTAVSVGDAVVTVTATDGGYTATCTVKVRADKSALESAINKASYVSENDVSNADQWAAFAAALDAANAVYNEEYASQDSVDAATKALEEAYSALDVKAPVTTVTIVPVSSSDEKSGDVIYHQVPWYKSWTSQTVELTVEVDEGAEIVSVEWSLANWSIDDPEGNIESVSGNNATIRPTYGVGPRSIWVQAVVTDSYGNKVASDPVKVRFYNYSWQK